MLALARRRQPNQVYRRVHPILGRNKRIFKGKMRFSPAAVDELAQITDPYLIEPQPNGMSITKTDQVRTITIIHIQFISKVLIFLSSMGSNAFQAVLCDRFGCCQQTISNIVNRVLYAITDPAVVARYIAFPVHDHRWRTSVSLLTVILKPTIETQLYLTVYVLSEERPTISHASPASVTSSVQLMARSFPFRHRLDQTTLSVVERDSPLSMRVSLSMFGDASCIVTPVSLARPTIHSCSRILLLEGTSML